MKTTKIWVIYSLLKFIYSFLKLSFIIGKILFYLWQLFLRLVFCRHVYILKNFTLMVCGRTSIQEIFVETITVLNGTTRAWTKIIGIWLNIYSDYKRSADDNDSIWILLREGKKDPARILYIFQVVKSFKINFLHLPTHADILCSD